MATMSFSFKQVAVASAVGGVLGVASFLALQKVVHFAQKFALKWLEKFAEQLIERISGQFAAKLNDVTESLKKCEEHLGQVAVTSQVCATRANITEWRSCLQSISDWRGVPLQAAYSIWQSGQSVMPSCPANQSLGAGSQPLALSDAAWGEESITSPAKLARFRQCEQKEKLEEYVWSVQSNMQAQAAKSWKVTKWASTKVIALESLKPFIAEVEEFFRQVLRSSPSDGRQFLSAEVTAEVAQYCKTKCSELEEWAKVEPSIAQSWESVY
jgi:hypothetical protein